MHVFILSFSLIVLVPFCHGQQKEMGAGSCSTSDGKPKIIDKDTIYTYSTNVNRLQLECLASYPIEWDVYGREMYSIIKQRITASGDILKDAVRCYNSTLIVYQSESEHVIYSRTGKYTCRSIQNKEISTSVYKFVHDHSLFAYPASQSDYYSERIESKEYLSIENGEFVIPCRANVESINASLIKIENPNKLFKLDIMNDYIRYDPKIGFLINATRFPFNPIGDYQCELAYRSETRDALIHLVPYHAIALPTYQVIPATENVPFNSVDRTITLKCRSNEEIYLSASNPETFQMFTKRSLNGSFVVNEYNPALHMQRKQTFRYEVSAEVTPKALSSGQVFCKTIANNSILHTWNYNLWYACDCAWNTTTFKRNIEDSSWEAIWQSVVPDLKGAIECKTKQQSGALLLSFHPCQNPTECKNGVFCDNGEQKYCRSFNSHHDTNTLELHDTVYLKELLSGVLECSVQGYGHRFHAHADLNKIVMGNPESQTYINITDSEQFILKRDPQIFKCEVATYFLSGDVKWAFQFKNKTFSFVETGLNRKVVETVVGNKLVSTITLEINDPDVEFLYCFAPVWNSSRNEWKNSSVPISVEDENSVEYPENLYIRKTCLEQNKSENNVPSIIMERYTETSARSNFTTFWMAAEKEFILRKRKLKKSISLICRAKYPVEWSFEGKKINTGFKLIESTMEKGGGNKSMCFESKIVIYDTVNDRNGRSISLQESTGKYVCQSNHDRNLKSTTYIYRHYNTSFPLINHGQHIKLEIEKGKRKSDSWTLFPCRVTHPSVEVKLYMYTYSDNEYTELTKGANVKYSPSKGFSVQNSLLDFTGHYICSTHVKDESHSISFSIIDKLPVITPSSLNVDSSNKTKNRSKCRVNRNGKSSKFLIVSITAAVILLALVVVILILFREIINQKKRIRDLTNGLSVSYSQRLRESNPAFMEEIHIPEHNHLVRPSSNYERF